ncbi:MAG: hypothetical protein IM613_17435 [Cytophagales bacterium]|nr:hypothetical protein [Cytophagales bacterium]
MDLTPAKRELLKVMQAFCFVTHNTSKAIKLLQLDCQELFNGRNNIDQVHQIVLSQITDVQAAAVLNQMPFCTVEEYHGREYVKELIGRFIVSRDSFFWIEQVLAPLPEKPGYKMLSAVTGCGIITRRRRYHIKK